MNSPSRSVININAINNGNWLIMQLIKDKNKIRWNQTGKLITEPNLDFFNKKLNVQVSKQEIWQTLLKIYDFKGLKNRNLVVFLKEVCGKPPWREKNGIFQKQKAS